MPREAQVAELPLSMRQTVKREVYARYLEGLDPDEAFDRMVAFTVEQLIDEDPDLAALEPLSEPLVAFAKRLEGEPDAMKGHPWARFPCEIVGRGQWAAMTAGECRMYGALLGIVDGKRLITMMGLKKIAAKAGLSQGQASRVLTSLKRKGLIARWRQRVGQYRPYITRVLPQGCFKDPRKAIVLEDAVMPKGT